LKNDFVIPIMALALVCILISGVLALGHSLTQPVIAEAAAERAEKARKEIIPGADEFVLITADNLPKTVSGVYKTTNNTGFIIMVSSIGYGGEIRLICGIDNTGKIIRNMVLAHNETRGLGTPVFEDPHAGQYWGKDANGIEAIQAISGATISSTAYKEGIRDAFKAYEIVKGMR